MRKILEEEQAAGSLGLSMYDRVKRRSSAANKVDEVAKKNRTLEILREQTMNKKVGNCMGRYNNVLEEAATDTLG